MSCKVSVIVPVYNCIKFLDNAVDSLLRQTYKDYELILIDDGSTDGSAEKCDEYSSEYVNITVIHENNSGVSFARNRGIEAAKGEYITFLDSDDRYESEYLSSLLKFADIDLVCCDYYCKEKNEKNLGNLFENKTYFENEFNNQFYSKIIQPEFFSCWNKLFKTKIIMENKLRFMPNVKYAEDMAFVFEYLKFCRTFRFIDKPLYFYNINPNNTTSVVKNGFEVQRFIYNYQTQYFNNKKADKDIFKKIEENFVYKTTCSINSEITYSSFSDAYKYIKRVLSSEFYELFIIENYSEFKCLYDRIFFNLLKKKFAFLVVLWRKMFDLRSKMIHG